MKSRALGLTLALTAGCALPTGPSAEVSCNGREAEYQQRNRSYFEALDLRVPTIPTCDESFAQVRVLHVGVGDASGTCTFSPRDMSVRAEPGMLEGCIVHELLHAGLYLVKHPCWDEFEHRGEEVRCILQAKGR